MKDVFGQELFVGDEVAVIVVGYSTLVTGRVPRFTPKRVVVEIPKRWGLSGTEERAAASDQVAKHQPVAFAAG